MISSPSRSWTARCAFFLLLIVSALAARAEGAATEGSLPLDIGRAEELAGKSADEVLARDATAEAALRVVDEARASFFPKLSASVSGAYLPEPPTGVKVPAGSLGAIPVSNPLKPGSITYIQLPPEELYVGGYTENSFFKGSLAFSQPLVAWGKIKAAVDLAALEAKAADIGRRSASLDARRSANRAYYSALLSRESLAVLIELRALAESILEDRRSAKDEGFSTQEQVLSSAADLASMDARLVQAREGEASALESLGLLTGLDPSSLVLVSPFRANLPSLAEGPLKDEALASSTDIALARTRLSQAKRKLDLERGSSLFLPDLALFANLDVSGQDLPYSSPSWWSNTWSWDLSVGVATTVDLFDGGAAAARKREAAASLEAARIGEGAAEKAARLEARRAIETAREAEASLREKEAKASWAAEALRNARAKAADQSVSRAELDAQAIVEATARLELLDARYALEESIADLERIEGKDIR
jgi:outer membrane protein TolC